MLLSNDQAKAAFSAMQVADAVSGVADLMFASGDELLARVNQHFSGGIEVTTLGVNRGREERHTSMTAFAAAYGIEVRQ